MAEETKVIIRKGAWYSYNGDNIGQGRENTIKYMEENPEFVLEVEQQVRQALDLGAEVSANSIAPMDVDIEAVAAV